MARTSIHVSAPPEAVFAVLSDPYSYEHWVVGCKRIRGVEGEWPEPGSAVPPRRRHGADHGQGRDVLRAMPTRPAAWCCAPARGRPGVARVQIDVDASGDGSEVTIAEVPIEGPPAMLHNPVQDWLIDRRNREGLRRLKQLAER